MTDTQVLRAGQESLRRYCTACGAPSEVSARFCGGCGLALDETSPTAGAAASSPAAEVGPPAPVARRRRSWLMPAGIGLAVVLVGAGAAGVVLMNQPHPEDAVLAEAAVAAEGLLEDMQAAQVTADLRAVAEDVDAAAEPVTDVLVTLNPADGSAQALAGMDEVFSALTGLAGIDADTLEVWPQVRDDLDTALDALPGEVEGMDPVTDAGAQAIEATDLLMADAEQTLADWQASVEAAEAASQDNAAAAEALTEYDNAVQGQLRTYNSLRNDTSSFVDLVESPDSYVTWEQGYDAMSAGAQARREVRDALNAIPVPDGVAAEHARLVAMVEDAAAAMDAGYSGLSEADACWFNDCYYADTSGWQTFRQESARITGEFAAADSAWQSALAGLRAPLGDVTATEKPVV